MTFHKHLILASAVVLSSLWLAGCNSGADESSTTVGNCTGTIGTPESCENNTDGGGTDGGGTDGSGTDGGGTDGGGTDGGGTDGGGTTVEENINPEIKEILNPDNCDEAQLGALDLLSGLSPEEISGSVGLRVIKGVLTYEDFPQKNNGSIDYDTPQVKPAFGSGVAALACNGSAISGVGVSEDGSYALLVPINIDVTLRVSTGETISCFSNSKTCSSWSVQVFDNTDGNSMYSYKPVPKITVSGVTTDNISVIKAGQLTVKADMHIPSGWNNETKTYQGVRYSAPFAIADVVFRTMYQITNYYWSWERVGDKRLITTGDGKRGKGIAFGGIKVAWSIKNRETKGLKVGGNIARSHYDPESKTIYLLGDSGVNTDEFDDDVIRGMLSLFLMQHMGRFDIIEGDIVYDGVGKVYDPRVAFYEGFQMGFATGVGNQRYFRDSKGAQATTDKSVSYDMESGALSTRGWYSIGSVAQIVHDVLDNPPMDDDQLDVLSFEVLDAIAEAADSGSFLTIFSFINALKRTVFDDSDADGVAGSPEDDSITSCSTLGNCTLVASKAGALGIDQALIDAVVASQNISTINATDSILSATEKDRLKKLTGLKELNSMTWGGFPGLAVLPWGTLADVTKLETWAGRTDLDAVISPTQDTLLLSDAFALREMNGSGQAGITLPPYYHAGVFGSWLWNPGFDEVICVDNKFGINNALGNRRLVAFTVFDHKEFEATKEYDLIPIVDFSFYKQPGSVAGARISIRIHKMTRDKATTVVFADGVLEDDMELSQPLQPGAYVLEMSTLGNLGMTLGTQEQPAGKVCYEVVVD